MNISQNSLYLGINPRVLKFWLLALSMLIIMTTSCTPEATAPEQAKQDQVIVKEMNGVIPLPVIIEKGNGVFQLNEETIVIVQSDELVNLGNQIAEAFTLGAAMVRSAPTLNSIFVGIDETISLEGYDLAISNETISISAGGHAGTFYALQTLKQLHNDTGFPAVTIQDAPRFEYRGMMLDVSRYFYGVDDVKRFIDLMAMHKFNKFHWHLTDDQGWRIEIKKYPLLTEVGSIRKETMAGHWKNSKDFKELFVNNKMNFDAVYEKDPNDYDDTPHGGFYTQDQAKEIIQYAADRFIEVIPEIEMPGHSTAALAAYPELACTTSPIEVSTRWSIHNNLYCPTDDTFKFLEDVLTEIIDLFPSDYVHIGGDEAAKSQWEDCADCQALIKEHNLNDEKGLQSYFIKRIDRFLTNKGKKLIGWDEILEGGLSENATVMSWQGAKGGIKAAKQKHEVIMAPNTHTYFDYYQDPVEAKQNHPLAQGGLLPRVCKNPIFSMVTM